MTKIINNIISLFLFLYCCTLAPSCSHLHHTTSEQKIGDNYWKQDNSINFLVVGDWGRNGEFHQKDVADKMGEEATKNHTSFILSMGDNFYPDGVISTTDPQWNKSFEDIYTSYSLNIPWYTVFGNHDYRGSIQAQLDYSKVSRRWRTNERYFSFERTIPNSSEKAIFIFIDTNPFDETLNGNSHSDLSKQDTSAQLIWLENTLANTNAIWKIVLGHHPLYTTGVRRDKMLDVRKAILPIFEKHKVNIYFAGHEHDLQHQKPQGFTHYFVSGAGSEIRPVTNDSMQTKFAVSDHGFMSVQLQKDTVHLKVINYLGKELYKTLVIK
jgi:tartrate-resistant acid phosphatase type 5